MKKIFLLLLITIKYAVASSVSILHKSIDYLEPHKKIVAREAVSTVWRVDIGKISKDILNYLRFGIGRNVDLDNPKKEGLVETDVHLIKKWLDEFYFSRSDFFYLAHPTLPRWLADKYENKTSEIFDYIALDPKYSFLGPESIRAVVVEYLFQEWKKTKRGHKEYWYVKKGIKITDFSKEFLDTIKIEIDTVLADAKYVFQYIETIKNNQVAQEIEYIIVPAANSKNQNVIDTLNAILDPQIGDPNLNIIIVFNDNVQAIPDEFKVLPIIKNLIIVGKNITAIGDFFLYDCSGLQSIDLTPLSQVTQIGYYFLYGCSGLQSIDLTPLSQVTQIENYFLSGCSGLQRIDLTPLSQVTKIGYFFLSGCSGLQSIDLTPLSQVTRIGNSFLSGCLGLQSIDLAPLSQVTQIESFFLYGCSRLQSIDLTPLSQVTQIGDSFLSNCSGLQSIDLTPLSQVTNIRDFFLADCSGLQSIDLTPLSQVTQIGSTFLRGCLGLQRIDLTPLSRITQIGDFFLYGCSGLQSIDLTPLSQVTKIGYFFMDRCDACKKIFLNQKLHNVLSLHNSGFLQKNKDKLIIQEQVVAGAAAAKAA